MCGITGIYNFSDRIEEEKLKAMTDALIHRGPDGEGFYFNEEHSLGFGHRRLSIIDLSEAGDQPFQSIDGRYTITFNGEIYNYLELRKQLEKTGEVFVSETDTEVLLKMYVHFDEDCLNLLDGMFAFCIWDNQKKTLFCARDRFGEKPFFYTKTANQFLFASEIKALWAAGISKKADPRKCYDYLLYGTVRDTSDISSTFYENIKELPASHFMKVDVNGSLSMVQYFNINLNETNDEINFETAQEQFADMFRQSIQRRLRSDVGVGSSLSGGLDSSSIVSMVNQLKSKNQKQKVFSARFKGYTKDEGEYIQQVLNMYPDLEAYSVFPSHHSVFDNLEKVIFHQDEPFNSLSISAQYEVFNLASSNNVKVLLDGQGADESLCGYQSFHQAYLTQLKKNDPSLYKQERAAFNKNTSWQYTDQGWRSRLKGLNNNYYKKIAKLNRIIRSPKSDYFVGIHPELVRTYKREDHPNFKPNTLKGQLKHALVGRGLSDLLRYADRNSMANSIEVRLPFLDHQIIEFIFTLPDNFLIKDGWTKYILRKAFENSLPPQISWRKEKIGFKPPQEQWMTNNSFKIMLNEAKEKLKTENIIMKEYTQLNWHYIMLAKYIQ